MGGEGNCRQDRAALFQSGFAELERNSSTKWGRRQDGRPRLRLRVLDHQLAQNPRTRKPSSQLSEDLLQSLPLDHHVFKDNWLVRIQGQVHHL